MLVCLGVFRPGYAGQSPLTPLAEQLLREYPALKAARAELEQVEAESRAASQPLYNPELELAYEDASALTRTLGLNQSIDWNGKRRARARVGQENLTAARARLAVARERILGEFIAELSAYRVTREAAGLGQRREALLADFLKLARQRFEAGDLSRQDVDLARLALSEARMQAATRSAEASDRAARLAALLAPPANGWPVLPALPEQVDMLTAEQLAEQLPLVRAAGAEAAAARARVQTARRERRPDPTLGVWGGREADDPVLGLSLSVPLYVRNTFAAEVDAAAAGAVRSEQDYLDRRRRAFATLQAATQRYRLIRSALHDWQEEGRRSLTGRIALLQRLWEAGEINTTDHLVQLKQMLDTELASVELLGQAWQAWSDWLRAAGRVQDWLGVTPAPAR